MAPGGVAAYSFEEGAGSVTVDKTGNGHNLTKGTLGDWTAGRNSVSAIRGDPGNTQAENGAGMYGAFPGGSPGGNPLAVLFWVRVPDMTNGAACVHAYNSSGRGDPWGVWVESDGSLMARWFSDADVISGSSTSATTGVVTADTWVHIAAVTVPGTGVTLYANGSIVTTYSWQPDSSACYPTWSTLLVGSSRWGSAGAVIDDLRIYHEALSGAQIATLMNQPI